MKDYTHIAWTDLETTGLDPMKDHLLEVGIVLTDLDLTMISERSWLVEPPSLDIMSVNPVVRTMHNENGLFRDLFDAQEERSRAHAAYPAQVAPGHLAGARSIDYRISDWLRSEIPTETRDAIALGGSGVSHFDSRWIERYLPTFHRGLHRSTLDVGVMRRFIENVVGRPKLVPSATRKLEHRALDDARMHLREARRYRDLLKKV